MRFNCRLEYGGKRDHATRLKKQLLPAFDIYLLMTIHYQLPVGKSGLEIDTDAKRTRSQSITTIRGSCVLTMSKITLLGIAIGSCNNSSLCGTLPNFMNLATIHVLYSGQATST